MLSETKKVNKYILDNKKLIKESKAEFLEDKYRLELQSQILEINHRKLQELKQEQVWNLDYFCSTDEESNDTDPELQQKQDERDPVRTQIATESKQIESLLADPQKLSKSDQEKVEQLQKIQKQLEIEKKKPARRSATQPNDPSSAKWDWYHKDDSDVYFFFSTKHEAQKKGNQMFIRYCKKSNPAFLVW